MNLPLSIVFDHHAIDGAYVGRYLNDVKHLLETPNKLLDEKRSSVIRNTLRFFLS